MDENFQNLVNKSKSDENIIGCILLGSRGKGFENEHSDYDVTIIVKDGCSEEYQNSLNDFNSENIDLVVMSISDFQEYATWGSDTAWDRYDYAHVKVLVDKANIAELAAQKGCVPKNVKNDFISASLDGYINYVFRSVKCHRNNNLTGAHLEASSSIPYLLDIVFAVNSRIKPFSGYLERELKEYPLKIFPWTVEDFLSSILYILETGNLKAQQEMLKAIEKIAIERGFQDTLEGWEGKDKWAMNFNK